MSVTWQKVHAAMHELEGRAALFELLEVLAPSGSPMDLQGALHELQIQDLAKFEPPHTYELTDQGRARGPASLEPEETRRLDRVIDSRKPAQEDDDWPPDL